MRGGMMPERYATTRSGAQRVCAYLRQALGTLRRLHTRTELIPRSDGQNDAATIRHHDEPACAVPPAYHRGLDDA